MAEPRTIQSLITPVFLSIADYRRLAVQGIDFDMETFRSDTESKLAKIKEITSKDKILQLEYARIEHALVFYIDYMVKEGPFPFKDKWKDLARNYQVLSGDEKFFEILDDVLKYTDNANTLTPFSTMLNLGFAGVYKNDPDSIEKYTRLCSEKTGEGADLRQEYITDFSVIKRNPQKKKKFFEKYKGFVITGGFALVSLVFAFIVFVAVTADFRTAVWSAADNSVMNNTKKTSLPPLRVIKSNAGNQQTIPEQPDDAAADSSDSSADSSNDDGAADETAVNENAAPVPAAAPIPNTAAPLDQDVLPPPPSPQPQQDAATDSTVTGVNQ